MEGRFTSANPLQLVKRAIERALDARFVTEEVFDGARLGSVVPKDECLTLVFFDAGVIRFEFLLKVGEANIEQAGFDAAHAGEAPGGHDHLVDEQIFGGPGGMVFGLEGFEHFVEVFPILVGEDGSLRGEAVAQGVRADGGAPFGSLRAGTLLGVAAVGNDLSLGGHGLIYGSGGGSGSGFGGGCG